MINYIQDSLLSEKPRQSGLCFFDRELKLKCEIKNDGYLIGVDEAGRGPLAGPVVACAAYIPEKAYNNLSEINDSKKLSPAKRIALFKKMLSEGVRFGFGYELADEIDRVNILNATFSAMRKAVFRLIKYLDVRDSKILVIVDGPHKIRGLEECKIGGMQEWKNRGLEICQTAVIDGDAKSLSIACASIFAKVIRDNWMNVMDLKYPEYGFRKHKGYGTPFHIEKIKKIGLSPVHRKSFELAKK